MKRAVLGLRRLCRLLRSGRGLSLVRVLLELGLELMMVPEALHREVRLPWRFVLCLRDSQVSLSGCRNEKGGAVRSEV